MTSDDLDPLSETSPLLSDVSPTLLACENDQPTHNRSNLAALSSRTVIVIFVLLYLIVMDLGYELISPALTRVLEKILCSQYYHHHDPSLIEGAGDGIDEKLCKIKEVQGQLAMLKGWQVTFDSMGMLLFSVPWAYVADTYGRRPVLLIIALAMFAKYSYIQFICYLGGAVPLKLTWLSSLHTIFGGSVTMGTALIYTIISDVLPEQQRLASFFQVQASLIATQFLGSLLSAALMVWNPWVPMLLGLTMELLGISIIFFIPETLRYKDKSSDLAEGESSPGGGGVSLHTDSAAPNTPSSSTALASPVDADGFCPSSWTTWRKSMYRRAQRPIAFLILSDTRIVLIVATFSVHMLFLNRDLMLQYISSRYQVTLAQATALVSIRSGLAFLLCVVLLPIVNAYCRNKLFAENVAQRSDMFLIRTSSVFLTVGFLGIGLAPNLPLLVASLVISSLSWGLWSLLRSLSTDLVGEAHHVARLNSFIGIVDTVGLMVGSPALAAMFTKGMELGGPWRGLPFVVCGAAVAVLALILARVRV